jgi:shikimate kinase
MFILGCKSSGKTTVGRYLADKLKIFHVSFHDLLQEVLLPKMKKPPLVDNDDWDGSEEDNEGTLRD